VIATEFKALVDEFFSPFMRELGFGKFEFLLNGRNYAAIARSTLLEVGLHFEPGEKTFAVYVFRIIDGTRSDIDDQENTFTLKDLNEKFGRFLTSQQREENREHFGEQLHRPEEEARMVRIGMDLRPLLRILLHELNSLEDKSQA
jgi:hypothetical protein